MALKQRLNKQLAKIEISDIRRFDQEVSQIPDMLRLTLGEPDFNTPQLIKTAVKEAIDDDASHYSSMWGIDALRQAASQFMRTQYQLSYDADREVLVTIGATEGIASSLMAILEAGDQVLVAAPLYPGYAPLVTLAGAELIELDTRASDFVLTSHQLEAALKQYDRVKAVILNYPSNPTGVVYSAAQIEALAQVIKQYDIFVLSDEIYSELTYTANSHVSIASYLPDQTIVLNGLSKSHAMTGYRIGFIFAKPWLLNEIVKTHQYFVTAAATPIQYGAVVALLEARQATLEMKAAYIERRDYLLEAMGQMGFKIIKPEGAFYIFAKIPDDLEQDDFAFLLDLAKSHKVAFIPGSAFGQYGAGYIRVSYAASMPVIKEAMKRLKAYIDEKR